MSAGPLVPSWCEACHRLQHLWLHYSFRAAATSGQGESKIELSCRHIQLRVQYTVVVRWTSMLQLVGAVQGGRKQRGQAMG
jgi:hypothetical protein